MNNLSKILEIFGLKMQMRWVNYIQNMVLKRLILQKQEKEHLRVLFQMVKMQLVDIYRITFWITNDKMFMIF